MYAPKVSMKLLVLVKAQLPLPVPFRSVVDCFRVKERKHQPIGRVHECHLKTLLHTGTVVRSLLKISLFHRNTQSSVWQNSSAGITFDSLYLPPHLAPDAVDSTTNLTVAQRF